MFKKPLAHLKTSAPLRGSDRRKLRQRIIAEFNVASENGDLLVPEGLQSQKFSTHLDEPGVLYLSPDGDPLWFTLGKGSDALIPTVYTLWKEPNLLPFLATPAAVVPRLVGGADLMIPGVVQHSSDFQQEQLVAISQYSRGEAIGYPIAVGRAAISSGMLKQADELSMKGKAVHTLHTWKDSLWDMGPSKKMEVPKPRSGASNESAVEAGEDQNEAESPTNLTEGVLDGEPLGEELEESSPTHEEGGSNVDQPSAPLLGPEDVSFCLKNALLQALSTELSSQPPSLFPMSASVFWANYVLPARPAQALGPNGLVDASAIDIKHSTHKSVKTFLKACAKEGLLKLKETKGDVVVTGVSPKHPAVAAHKPHRTIHSVEVQREKADERERKQKEAEEKKNREIQITELLKPFGSTIAWFVAAEKDTEELYAAADVREIFNSYVSTKQLINANEQQYINITEDEALARAVSIKGQTLPEFMKRDDAMSKIQQNMQNWYEVRTEGGPPVWKKGEVKRVGITQRMRLGRKAVTLITGFELFGLDAEELAEELRRVCSSSTSVAPLPGKPSGMEVMVQGKQMKAVMNHLISKGVPKNWIRGADMLDAKKKK
ncbi:eukaryotic translation initiation factor SUI1 family protein [Cytidiella melzeri]|nr:eukaryotic translation initiation factor SUI1 family protein [Cytidiella melzeri]